MKITQTNIGSHQQVTNNEYNGPVNSIHDRPCVDLSGTENYKLLSVIEAKDQNRITRNFLIPFVLGGISLIADILQIFPFLNIPIYFYGLFFFVVLIIFAIFYTDNLLILLRYPASRDKSYRLDRDRLIQMDEEGDYQIFTLTGRCMYPDCPGHIVLTNSPERFNGNYSYYAECSFAGKQHSYGIDFLLKAYPEKIDWRRLDPQPKK